MKLRPLIIVAVTVAIALLCPLGAMSQDIALKTNLASDMAANVTAGGEIVIAPRWTLQAVGSFNDWTFNHGEKRWKHWSIMPEGRYWFCDVMGGHFIGAHIFGGQYNVGGINVPMKLFGTDFHKMLDHRFQGWYVGAGVAYGYAWELSKHWNIEAELGFGWAYTRYDEFRCTGCGKRIQKDRPHNYVGPTKAAINLVYIF